MTSHQTPRISPLAWAAIFPETRLGNPKDAHPSTDLRVFHQIHSTSIREFQFFRIGKVWESGPGERGRALTDAIGRVSHARPHMRIHDALKVRLAVLNPHAVS